MKSIRNSKLNSVAYCFADPKAWFDRSEHRHVSAAGTPMAHPFRLEPASIHEDLFVDYSYREGAEGKEHEVELEVEFALSRRIGLVMELPYSYLDAGDGASVNGFGDLAIAPRFLLAEYKKFFLAFNIEVELPTGNKSRGLGGSGFAFAPSFSTWHDLGNWWVLNTQTGLETSSQGDELFVLASLIHTFGNKRWGRALQKNAEVDHGHADHEHVHSPQGLLSLILEMDSRIGLSGDAGKGQVGVEGIVGAYYGVTETFNLRLAYQFPLTSPREFDRGLIVGGLWFF